MVKKNSKKLLACIFLLLILSAALFKIRPVVIVSGSMEPAISTGSLAIVACVSAETIKKGDVILFTFGNGQVAHRVTEKTSGGFVTKGDANDTPDFSPVQEDAVKGKVLFAIPYLGYLAAFMQNHLHSIIALVILAYIWCKWQGERRKA